MGVISIHQVESISEVDASEWDRLAGQNVSASYGWLKTVEESYADPKPCRYIMVRGPDGLLAAATGSVEEKTDGVIGLDDVFFGRCAKFAQHLGLSMLPSLVCGTRTGTAGPILLRSDIPIPERGRLIHELVQAVEQMARAKDWSVCFREVSRTSPWVMEVLDQRGYLRSPELPWAYLDIHGSSFPEFRRHLSMQHPSTAKNMLTDINRGRRHGVVIEQVEEPARYGDSLHRLMNAHYVRLNRKPFPFGPSFFERLKLNLGGKALIYVARIGDELVGVLAGLKSDCASYISMIGVDHKRGRAGAVYFNLCYNRPIQDAIAAGDRRMYYGKLLYQLKAKRGCKALDGNLYFRTWNRPRAQALRLLSACRAWRIGKMTAAIPREDESVRGACEGIASAPDSRG